MQLFVTATCFYIYIKYANRAISRMEITMPQIDVLKLCEYFEKSNIFKFEYSVGDEKLVLKKESTAQPVYLPAQSAPFANAPQGSIPQSVQSTNSNVSTQETAQDDGTTKVKAPLVGVFYAAPSPEEKPFVMIGDSVKKGQTLCLLEAMKMMSEVTSPVDGVVKNILVNNEAVVGFEDVLFEVEEC